MILTCPECSTRYQADAAKFLPAGRNVKCANCGHLWHQAPPPPPEPEPDLAIVAPEPPPPPPAPEPSPRPAAFAPAAEPARERTPLFEAEPRSAVWAQRAATATGWIGLVLILFLIGWTGIHFRQDIATLWPRSASLYKSVGLGVNPRGIEIVDVRNSVNRQNGARVLVVSGKLVNISGRELPVPQIRIALLDGSQRELYHWPVLAAVATLRPGQSEPFQTRLADPPRAAQVEVTFARSDE